MADPRNGGPSEWRPFGMADPKQVVGLAIVKFILGLVIKMQH